MRKEKSFKLKEAAVLRTHMTKDGKPRKINEPSESSRMRYYTKKPDGQIITSNTYEGLIEKLYDYYLEKCMLILKDQDYRLSSIFDRALENYTATRNPSENTINKYKCSYKRFLGDCPLTRMDIRRITEFDLQKFTQEMVTAKRPKKKAYFDYMSVLHLIFNYARHQKIIADNPVDYLETRVYLKSCDQTKPKSQEKIMSPAEIQGIIDEMNKRIARKPYYVKDTWCYCPLRPECAPENSVP